MSLAENSCIVDIEIIVWSPLFSLQIKLIFVLYPGKVSKIQPIRMSFVETEQPIRSLENVRANNFLTLQHTYWSDPTPYWIKYSMDYDG